MCLIACSSTLHLQEVSLASVLTSTISALNLLVIPNVLAFWLYFSSLSMALLLPPVYLVVLYSYTDDISDVVSSLVKFLNFVSSVSRHLVSFFKYPDPNTSELILL
jgi:hypothetical protein